MSMGGCDTILGGIMGTFSQSYVQACQNDQAVKTYCHIGEVIGGVMAILGIILIVMSGGGTKKETPTTISRPEVTMDQYLEKVYTGETLSNISAKIAKSVEKL